MKFMKRTFFFLAFTILFISLKTVYGGEVILTVKTQEGMIHRTFTEEDIRALPAKTFTTFDPWEKRKRTYTGCRVNDFLDSLNLDKTINMVQVIAKDDYNAKISGSELKRYNYILSYEMDDRDYSQWGNSDKGPLAVMIKMEDVKNEDKVRVKNQMVLWVKEIILY